MTKEIINVLEEKIKHKTLIPSRRENVINFANGRLIIQN